MLLGNRSGRSAVSMPCASATHAAGASRSAARTTLSCPFVVAWQGIPPWFGRGWRLQGRQARGWRCCAYQAVRVAPPPPIAPQRGKLTLSVSSGLAHGPLLAARPVRAIRLARGACRLAGQDRRGDSDLVVAMRAADDLREASAGWLPPAPFQGRGSRIPPRSMMYRWFPRRAGAPRFRCTMRNRRLASGIEHPTSTLTMAAAVHIPMVETQGIATSGSLDPVSAQRAGAGG